MLRVSALDATGIAIVFWHGTVTSQEDVDALHQAITTKLAKADLVLDFSEVETLGSGASAVTVCTVTYRRLTDDTSRDLQPFADVVPGTEKGVFPVPGRRSHRC